MIRTLRAAGVAIALSTSVTPLWAELAEPEGPVILEVSGELGTTVGENVGFDLGMLDALPQRTTTTKTPWFDGETSFSGPLLSDVVEAVEGEGDIVRVYALNDYAAELSREEIETYPVILATRMEGKRLSVRDKGPLFVIYPFSEAPELYNEVVFNKSVWQVARIEVE